VSEASAISYVVHLWEDCSAAIPCLFVFCLYRFVFGLYFGMEEETRLLICVDVPWRGLKWWGEAPSSRLEKVGRVSPLIAVPILP
jgi:hypothetical protein